MTGMYGKLPRYVYLNDKKFFINTDFRIFIDFEEEMQGGNKTDAMIKVLQRFYPAFFDILNQKLYEEAVKKFVWFYKCGKNREYKKEKGSINQAQIFNYRYDDIYIWGAFNMYFKVDLTRDYIHWWKFRAMWLSIPNDSQFNKIKSYRAYDGKNQNLIDLREYYKLPLSQSEINNQVRQAQIYEMAKKLSEKR